MLQISSKLIHYQPHHLLHPLAQTTHPPQTQTIATTNPPAPIILEQRQCPKFTRRDLTIFSNSSLLLLVTSQTLDPRRKSFKAQAEEIVAVSEEESELGAERRDTTTACSEKIPTKRAFLDISIEGIPAGRITIGLYEGDAPAGAARFSDLVSGRAGISYRRKGFIKILPNYVQHGGVRSYGVDAELAKRTGTDLVNEGLVQEWERVSEECTGTKNLAGTVSIIVRDPSKPPPKMKLVARKGKLEIDEEEVGVEPNGTEFVMSIKDSPELDASALVVGRVLEGMDVVQRIGQVKTVQENTGSPYFR